MAKCLFCGKQVPEGTLLHDITEDTVYIYSQGIFTQIDVQDKSKIRWKCSLEDAEVYCPECCKKYLKRDNSEE